LKTFELLECDFSNFDFLELKTSFIHFSIPINVYCILAAHMIKLIKNTFFDKMLYSKAGEISFKYIQVFHTLQEMEDLKLCNKLSKEHINFYNKKMNVRLAVQIISSSVADAIDFLRKAGNQDFINSEATTEFIRIFDRLFDITNVRNSWGTVIQIPFIIK